MQSYAKKLAYVCYAMEPWQGLRRATIYSNMIDISTIIVVVVSAAAVIIKQE